MNDIPIDDGGNKPLGYQTPDGELEVRTFVDNEGQSQAGYCETELGQHQRWMRQAPELFERHTALTSRLLELARTWHLQHEPNDDVRDAIQQCADELLVALRA